MKSYAFDKRKRAQKDRSSFHKTVVNSIKLLSCLSMR